MNDAFDPRPPTSSLVAGICHCSSPHEHASRAADQAASSARHDAEQAKKEADKRVSALQNQLNAIRSTTPDASNYEITDVREVGPHLVLKVKYPNCAACAYEGAKVMVFLGVTPLDAMHWRKIDPHFRDPRLGKRPKTEAPPPAARFPGNAEGWADALEYAERKKSTRATTTNCGCKNGCKAWDCKNL